MGGLSGGCMELELKNQGLLICVSGPSGVGKGTVIAAAKALNRNLLHSVSVTTRSPRPGEIEGISYYFRTEENFEAMLAAGEILEHDVYCGHYYGTPLRPIQEKLQVGMDIVMDVTVPGSLTTIGNYPDAISIFLLPPSLTELRRRLVGRGTETAEVVEKRMNKAISEIGKASHFKYILVNHDVQMTAQSILHIIDAEKHRAELMRGIEEVILNR